MPDNFALELAIVEAHTAQLRAQALDYLYEKGEDYADGLNGVFDLMQMSGDEHYRILGLLAEIGLSAVMCGHAASSSP